MRAFVVYESMYGNTRAVAEAVASGLSTGAAVEVRSVAGIAPQSAVDLLVLGGPTHMWGLSSPRSRQSAEAAAARPDSGLELQPDATGPGLREYLAGLATGATGATGAAGATRVAVFDTRMHAPLGLSGSAARAAARRLRKHGVVLAAAPQHFTVSRDNRLVRGELERASAWGRSLLEAYARSVPASG